MCSLDDGEKMKSRERKVSDERGDTIVFIVKPVKNDIGEISRPPTRLEFQLTRQIHLKTSI